jgi:hypothetical protein
VDISIMDSKGVKSDVDPADLEQTHSVQMGSVAAADADIAASYANQLSGENSYTRKEETRLRWKLDLRLVPLLWFNVTLGAMDKGMLCTHMNESFCAYRLTSHDCDCSIVRLQAGH